jgi:predicted alpha/beta-fold hydrolase
MIVTDYPALKANFLYKNKHLSTILPALFRKHDVTYTRKRINTPDNDFFNVDCILHNNKKAIVLIHGLEGSSQSQYIKGFAKLFSQNQFDVHAMNFRSCGGEANLLPQSYHSGFTADLTAYIDNIGPKYDSIYLVGFSLGGNVLLKYLSNNNQVNTKVTAAAAISVPVDLKGSAMELDNGLNRIYLQRFINSLSKKMLAKSKQFPGEINTKGIHKIKTFKEFDDAFTAPLHGFKNADDYWNQCSSVYGLNTIATPTLLINAKNDPFLSPSCFPFEDVVDHPFLHAIFTPIGGHVGFMLNSTTSWLEPVIFSFFED